MAPTTQVRNITMMSPSQMTSALMCRSEGEAESLGARPLRGATREARYIELMRTMQFGEHLHCFYWRSWQDAKQAYNLPDGKRVP